MNKNKIFAHLASSLVTTVIVLGVAGGIVWWKRAEVFHYFASQFLTQQQEKSDGSGDVKKEATKIITQEALIVDVVKKADPAVFSIVISKDVPVIEQYYENWNPFKDFFGGDFGGFQVPQYRQKGTEKKEVGGGTGFLVNANGLAITNRHVVDDTTASYTALMNNGKKYPVEVIAKDPVLDLAVIRLTGASNMPFLSLGDSSSLEVGETAIAIGNALGEFRNTVSVGIISGLSRSITASDQTGKAETLEEVIQTDAAINPGNSGGPLLSLAGKVIGINVAVAQGSQNVGFSLPANLAKIAISSVEKYGKIVRPYIGIRYADITPAIQQKNNLTVDYGALVVRGAGEGELAVVPDSPADKAGIVENDIILEVDGVKITSEHSLSSLIRKKNVGDTVRLKILHKGAEKFVSLKLEALKD
jgi:serine protease Do